jgi:hypothetical protein
MEELSQLEGGYAHCMRYDVLSGLIYSCVHLPLDDIFSHRQGKIGSALSDVSDVDNLDDTLVGYREKQVYELNGPDPSEGTCAK